jgi:EAL domain-containing protein (putative c-di-GMP-specific phosphodiesterase class I)
MSLVGRRDTLETGSGGAPRARAALRLLKEAKIPVDTRAEWLLESLLDGGKETRKMPIAPMPFRIGRLSGQDLVLPSQLVSKSHAEIYDEQGSLRLRDLHSTNGTFVNRKPVEDVALHEGDIIHFADFEFRVGRVERTGGERERGPDTLSIGHRVLSRGFAEGTREVKEMLDGGLVTVLFQPIVRLPGGQVDGYEVLGRGAHPGLPEDPVALFKIAADIHKEVELSRLFRRKSLEVVRHRRDLPTLFLNTHPAELASPGLLESLAELRQVAPHVDLALEIHESALAQPDFIVWLRAKLSEINVGIAYDDFGAGQARLLELAEAPPHFLKFDRRFISGIESAPAPRRRLLASLVAAARELLVKTVAEGVETAAEAEVCAKAGFTHAQGYYFARPHPFEAIP